MDRAYDDLGVWQQQLVEGLVDNVARVHLGGAVRGDGELPRAELRYRHGSVGGIQAHATFCGLNLGGTRRPV